MNVVQQIYDFNQQAGLLDKGYDDFLESSFQIEEALEGFKHLANVLQEIDSFSDSPKDVSRAIVATALGDLDSSMVSDVDRLDKACDAIIYAYGSIFKLGLTPTQATQALQIVMNANFTKLNMPKDAYGKLTKPTDFINPEPQLQQLLNTRKGPNDTSHPS